MDSKCCKLLDAIPFVFICGAIAAIINIVRNEVTKKTYNRQIDYPCFLLVIIDLVLIIFGLQCTRDRCIFTKQRRRKDKKLLEEKLRLVDDVLGEILFYPVLVCSVIGVATDRVWNEDFRDREGEFGEILVSAIVAIRNFTRWVQF